MCARECVRGLLAKEPALCAPGSDGRFPVVHVIMNLPELALDFLDAFRGMLASGSSSLFAGSALRLDMHCYCFAHDPEHPEVEIHPRMVAALGHVPESTKIREVRDVAPKKNMYCVEFS